MLNMLTRHDLADPDNDTYGSIEQCHLTISAAPLPK
jgi:hypothetical protein